MSFFSTVLGTYIKLQYFIDDVINDAFNEVDNIESIAIEIINLISDKALCRAMAIHAPKSIIKIIDSFSKHIGKLPSNCNNVIGKQLVSNILTALFNESNSILYREKNGEGLGIDPLVSSTIFENEKFLTSAYQPLSSLFLFNDIHETETVLTKYFEVIEMALKHCLRQKKYLEYDYSDFFYRSLANLHITLRKHMASQSNKSEKIILSCLLGVHCLILRLIVYLELPNEIPEIHLNEYDYYKNDRNIYGALANGIYKIFETVGDYKSTYFFTYRIMLDLYFENSARPNRLKKAISDRLTILFKKIIDENIIGLYFPRVTPMLIYSVGLREPTNAKIELHIHLLKQLKNHFAASYKRDKLAAMEMLPDECEYNETDNQLIMTIDRGVERTHIETLQLEPLH